MNEISTKSPSDMPLLTELDTQVNVLVYKYITPNGVELPFQPQRGEMLIENKVWIL